MLDIFASLCQYVEYYPFAAFAALLLAGVNVPISEDLIIITGALLCQEEPSMLIPIFGATYAGVIISDYFPYLLGKYIRKGTIKTKFLTRFFSPKKIVKIHRYMEKYGILTFIVGRFIPFGVRNSMFMTAGLFGLRLRRFALYDTTAATISVSSLFFLAYHFGEVVGKRFQVVGIVLFALLLSTLTFALVYIIRNIRKRKGTGDRGSGTE
ncbi:MAG: DedA family protein [Treponema sp.]|jgi:membrane protein DedA with SNARE-associated domain|nr:DedA family protein [Treponema sp.]